MFRLFTERSRLLPVGAAAFGLAVLLELGSTALTFRANTELGRPGLGIPALGLLDVLVAYTMALMLQDLIPAVRQVMARVVGVASIVGALIGIFVSIAMVVKAFFLLQLMIALLLAVPFGTALYLDQWGTFDSRASRTLLGLAMTLKLLGAAVLVLAATSLLKNRGIVLLVACSIGATFVLTILHSLFPGFLVSITDAIGAIIVGIVAVFWYISFMIGALLPVIRAARSTLHG